MTALQPPFARVGDRDREIAPDAMAVQPLITGERGGLAEFGLAPDTVGRAVRHRSVEELWVFTAGGGEMYVGGVVEAVEPGVVVRIEPGTVFQLRSLANGLAAIAVTMPPWPGDDEAEVVEGPWRPTVPS